jgi:3-oxoacyl-[acyl-carrier protein] reductase
MDINNKTFVVTGAARGLGYGIAHMLAENGGRVALIDQDEEGLKKACEALPRPGDMKGDNKGDEPGHPHSWHLANVADEASVVAAFNAIATAHNGIHGLVNNAGILRDGLLLKTDKEDPKQVVQTLSLSQWQAVIDVNLTGVFLCGREAAKHMVTAGNAGVIVNLSSVSRAGNMGQSNYAAAKAGVAALTVTWAKELASKNIRVAALAPGVFGTDMVASMKPEALERMLKFVPLGRLGEVSELAHSVRYLVENDFFTGRVLEIDGGIRL